MTRKPEPLPPENRIVWLISLPVRAYRFFISPLLGPHCRFHPTCSSYCLQGLQQHGAMRGGYLGLKRILKCHPGYAGGIDPVPEKFRRKPKQKAQKPLLQNCKNQHSETTT